MNRVLALGSAQTDVGRTAFASLAASMHEALYAQVGFDASVSFRACATAEDAAMQLAEPDVRAAFVAVPLQPAAFDASTVRAASARLSRGASWVIRRDTGFVGVNTMGTGCVSYLERQGYSLGGARVVVCGEGPAALATVQAVAAAGAERIVLIDRVKQSSERLLTRFIKDYKRLAYATVDLQPEEEHHRSFREAYVDPDYLFGSYRTSTQAIRDADVLIRVPGALDGAVDLPFSEELLGAQTLVLDAADLSGAGVLIAAAAQAGCGVLDGRGVLAAQVAHDAALLLQLKGVDNMPSTDDMFAIALGAATQPC